MKVWKRGGSGEFLEHLPVPKGARKLEREFLQGHVLIEHRKIILNLKRVGYIKGGNSSLCGW